MNQSSDYDERIKETNRSRVEELINNLKGNVQCPDEFWKNLIEYLQDISRKNEYFKQFRSETYEMDAMLKVFFDWKWSRNDIHIPSETTAFSRRLTMKEVAQTLFKPYYQKIKENANCSLCKVSECRHSNCIHEGFNKHKNFVEVSPDIFIECDDTNGFDQAKFSYMKEIYIKEMFPYKSSGMWLRSAYSPDLTNNSFPIIAKPHIVGEVGPAKEWHIKMVQLERDVAYVCMNAMYREEEVK
jgi:hypothetical protein